MRATTPTDGAAADDAMADEGGRAFRRMRAIATALLALMAVVFIAASYGVQHRWPLAGWIRAFAEAAMVGACADWFAVTALFRRPLGLPIPHTGLVPRNKQRIGAALGGFIADNFLTREVLEQRLRELQVARWGGAWVGRADNARWLAGRIAEVAPTVLEALPKNALRDLVGSAARAAAEALPASVVASKVMSAAWADGRADAVITKVLEAVGAYLDANQAMILEQVQAQSWKWLPKWVDKMIARKITSGLIDLLHELRDPGHDWRVRLDQAVGEWTLRLASDPEWQAKGEALKARLLADPQFIGRAGEMWSSLEAGLIADLRSPDGVIAPRIEAALKVWAGWIEGDERVQLLLDEAARAVIRDVVAPNRQAIGDFVARVVSAWDTASIVEKLEQQVGRDLQYIRINGTVVGGLVGLLIYAVSRLCGFA